MAETSEDYAKRTERIKALLSSYYGGQEGAGGAGGAGGGDGAGAGGPRPGTASFKAAATAVMVTMDSPAFNADRHMATMLRTYPLEKLMVRAGATGGGSSHVVGGTWVMVTRQCVLSLMAGCGSIPGLQAEVTQDGVAGLHQQMLWATACHSPRGGHARTPLSPRAGVPRVAKAGSLTTV